MNRRQFLMGLSAAAAATAAPSLSWAFPSVFPHGTTIYKPEKCWNGYTVFGVENIMRIGSTGAMQENINLRDIVIGQGACTDSNWAGQYHLPGTFAPIADYHMLETCVETAKELGLPYHVGNILSSDRFLGVDCDITVGWIVNLAW